MKEIKNEKKKKLSQKFKLISRKIYYLFKKNKFLIMFSLILFLFCWSSLALSQIPLKPPQSNSLKMLIEVTRHGARSPLYDNFTTSVWNIHDFWQYFQAVVFLMRFF